MGRVQNTGKIGKPMITLHGTLDTLLPIDTDSNPYRELIEEAGQGKIHRYYKIKEGNPTSTVSMTITHRRSRPSCGRSCRVTAPPSRP